jgi:MmgE/PrpD N-terminal domain
MASIDRRTFLWATTAIAAGAAAPEFATATESNTIKATTDQSPTPTPEVTKALARYIVSAGYESLPEKVRKEGVRTLLNWVGVAVGGSRHETVNIALAALEPFSGRAKRPFLDAENALIS